MHSYAGNPAAWIANVGLVDDADLNPAVAAVLDVAAQNLADRTAYLNAQSLFKTGGTVTGTITISPTGAIVLQALSSLTLGTIVMSVQPGGFGKIDMQSGSDLTVDNGALIDVLSGGLVTVELGGSIHANGAGAVLAQAVGSVKSTVNGGIQFGGGPTDFGSFSAARTIPKTFPCVPLDPTLAGGTWGYNAASIPPVLVGKGNASAMPLRLDLHNGANLSSIAVTFAVSDPHAGGVPFAMPRLSLWRVPVAVGSAILFQTLSATDPQIFPTPLNGAAWYASGFKQQLTYTTDQNFTIDNVNYVYYLVLTDETGSGSHPNNVYLSVTATYSNISDLRFPN